MANKLPSILIFDIGKTNKKVLLFNEAYEIIHEESTQLNETKDEDGFPCEDVDALTNWVQQKFAEILLRKDIELKAVNFSAYGASFVYLDKAGNVLLPLYNYLKPYPQQLKDEFYNKYGGEKNFAKQTASPVLGSLNSGMQLYRLKYEKPEVFSSIAFALHLPQYLSYIFTDYPLTDITSIGCHTNLWNFEENTYHTWVDEEHINDRFAPVLPCTSSIDFKFKSKEIICGFGLHDSSAALIPYFNFIHEQFVLISTGTWCISLNPFNQTPLTSEELQQDCLCYLSYQGKPVKASRLFAGYEHEQQVKRLAIHFNKADDYYKTVLFEASLLKNVHHIKATKDLDDAMVHESLFELNDFETYEEAYHRLMFDIIIQQKKSTEIILQNSPVKRIFVDGGFSQNAVYMNLLASAFADIHVYSANIAQASALGAALAIHEHWNSNPVPDNLISLKVYKALL